MKKITAFLLRHEYLIWILCATALLRLPSLLEPYWYGDEGIYLTLGNAIRHGLTLYRDIHDNKPPLIYFMAALTGSVFWFRFFLLLWNSVAIVIFSRLAHLLLDTTDFLGFVKIRGINFPKVQYSTIATALFAILPFFAEGAIANGEIFMIGPTIVAMFLLWNRDKIFNSQFFPPQRDPEMGRTILNCAGAGFFFSIAFLIKVPSLFDAIAAGFFFFIVIPFTVWREKRKEFRLTTYLLPLVSFSLAFLLPIIMSFAYYSTKGVGKQYVAAAFAQNIGYLSSWATGTHAASNVGSSGLKNRALTFGIALVALAVLAKKNGKKMTFVAIWFAAALFGALLAERPYPHYLIQIIPPTAILIIFAVKLVLEKLESRSMKHGPLILASRFFPIQFVTIVIAFALFFYSLFAIKFWYYPLTPYFKNYIAFVTRQKTKDQYFEYFDPSLPSMYAVSDLIRSQTSSDERVFVWGDYPMIYALSRRLPPGRYTSSYHIKDFKGFDETTAAIQSTMPRYVVVDTAYDAPYPALSLLLSHQYIRVGANGRFVLYRRFEL